MLIKIGSALIDPEEIAAIVPDMDETVPAYEKATHIRMDFKHGGSVWIDATMDEAEAAMIDAGVVTDLTADHGWDRSALPQMTNEEIARLYVLESDGYAYLARDKDGKLFAFRRRPEYGGFYWSDPSPFGASALQVDERFAFIGEDDSEPTEISELLDDPS